MVGDNATWLDKMVGMVLALGGALAFAAFVCWADPRDAPNPKKLAEVYDTAPIQARAFSTGAVILAIDKNRPRLRVKLVLAKVALAVVLVASTFGVGLKVVESEWQGIVHKSTAGGNLPSIHKPGGSPPGWRFP
jgi:hypothetical protein